VAAALTDGVLGEIWSARDTTPGAIEAALRDLLEVRDAESRAHAPARVVNLVAVVDREWKGEILNRLERVGRYHPSRTVLCAFEEERTTLDAWATMACDVPPDPGSIAACQERVEVELGPRHLARLDSIVDPLIVPDLTTVVWSPHGHPQAIDALRGIADVVLLDSGEEPDPRAAMARALDLGEQAYVVDLAWLRSTPWRERVAATFDPPAWRPMLREIGSVTVRHGPESAASGLLLLGWLSARLGWHPSSLVSQNGHMRGRARAGKVEVRLCLEPAAGLEVPGLAGMTVETVSGMSLSLDRGHGGLAARRVAPDGRESSWVVLGASRGEAGILGEGIRQALLRDPTYRPAAACAAAFAG
jgi:glucose-6-phosphate dehydrogenase assembly protein OpcA